ncbi:MAG: DNA topoisomerase II large subunit [Hatfieldvirus porci]|uniref:DNA topoisomerase (ATP-hydrolyzing) n=1 Tax=phage Lak_Megaphage_RVC_JS4_GC31 TaxID=3109228 RepID=A0ABZ0Z1W4_9CAUD|nr:MAG: DNA topoisomerase II large subunit [phage Lak_Megaphage_RVC_AP3_GC31]WQJ53009.1 MAG: DNA topoisomerase II large subunit [phage Lak_Megaphage_RVC_JS4_GC31]
MTVKNNKEIKSNKSIENKYQSMSELDHILQRSGMYIGSVKNETKQMFLYSADEAKMQLADVEYSPALLKLLDEIISNSCDEYRRKDNMGLTELSVTLDKYGTVTVRDNGGIPVVKHKEAGIYIPEFIFGQLRTSSNYDDTEDRDVIGTNGIGSKICNIFSTNFSIYTADKKHSYYRSWKNNMKDINDDLEVKICKEHFTESTFSVDFSRFECGNEFSDNFITIIEKRCIDAAAANIGLVVKFKYTDGKKVLRDVEWHFKTFDEYIELYSDYVDISEVLKFKDNIMQVWIFPDNGINVGFVNGAECSKGTHINAVRKEINNAIAAHLLSKEKIEITPKNVDGKYSMFCTFHVNNPSYDSQTKETLTTPVERFSSDSNYTFSVPDTFIKSVLKSEIIDIVLDWYKQKMEVEDQKTLRKLNKQAKNKIRNNEKFIDANSKKSSERQLWIFEGDSARAGFRAARDPQTQAAYMLRGVILNVLGLSPSKIMANKELSDIITILGLQWGEPVDVKKLNFGKIVIATDADFDGSKIAGLLLTFFNIWPELYDAGIICRCITPIITATKGKDKQLFYSLEEFRKQESKLKGYKIRYNKGLGGSTNEEYKDMMRNSIFHYFKKDELSDITIKSWFGKGIAKERKEMLKNEI